MVFWICLAVLIFGIILCTVVYRYSTSDLVAYIGFGMTAVSAFILMSMFVSFTFSRIEINSETEFAAGLMDIAENEDAFRDDSGQEEFLADVQKLNERIALKKEIQDDFWSRFLPINYERKGE